MSWQAHDTLAQQWVFDKLDGVITATVYDDVPHLPSGLPEANFPFVTVGISDTRPWDTDLIVGADVMAQIHVWSLYKGMKEVKEAFSEIYNALNRQTSESTYYQIIDTLFENSHTMLDPDGITRHGVITFRIRLQSWFWILVGGTWHDAGQWVDGAVWIDS